MEKATRRQLKIQNHDLVLRIFFDSSRISRAEIARITGLTRTTVSDIVSDLIEEGLVAEVGVGKSTGGKSPILLSLVEDAYLMIGLDLGYFQFRGAVVDLRGKIHRSVSLPVEEQTGNQALDSVFWIIDQLIRETKLGLIGIGVGTPGLVNTQEGIVLNAVNLDWHHLPLGQILRERYGLPVIVLNDCQAAAMGEFKFSENPPASGNVVVVRVGYGIGSGVIIDGKIFHGDGGSAGEIGHVTMTENGSLPCRCGKTGCLETLASVQAVVQRAALLVKQGCPTSLHELGLPVTLERLIEAHQAGDALAREIVNQAAHSLGVSISYLVSTLNIHQIILMGEMTRFGKPWLDRVQKSMLQAALDGPGQDTRLQVGSLHDDDVILGAAALFASDYSLLWKQPASPTEKT